MSTVLSAIETHRMAATAYRSAIETGDHTRPLAIIASNTEREALAALVAAPAASFSEVATKAAYLTNEVDSIDDYLSEEGRVASLLQSLGAPADPLAMLIAELREGDAAINHMSDDEFNAACREPFPALDRLQANPPAAANMIGVEAALQLMADEDAKGNDWLCEGFFERAVLSFFKGRPADPVTPDPLLEIVQRYRSQLAEFNKITGKTAEEANAIRDATWGPFEIGVEDGTIVLPAATTMAGAAAAIRCACEEDTTQAVAGKMRDAALAFLEGGAPAPADPFLERMGRYRSEVDAYNALPDELSELDEAAPEPGQALRAELASGALAIQSVQGAAEAMRYVIAQNTIKDTLDEQMARSVSAFLDKAAAR